MGLKQKTSIDDLYGMMKSRGDPRIPRKARFGNMKAELLCYPELRLVHIYITTIDGRPIKSIDFQQRSDEVTTWVHNFQLGLDEEYPDSPTGNKINDFLDQKEIALLSKYV